MGVNAERMVRMFGEGDWGGAVPVARIEYVNRFLVDPDDGKTVGALILEDRIQVCSLYPRSIQRASINSAISELTA